MYNPSVTEHPNQWAIVENRFYGSIDDKYMLLWDKNLEIPFKACNFRFASLRTLLRRSVKSSLLSIMTPKSFSEALFLIVIFLHLKLGKVLGVPRVIKWHLSEFSTRKLLKNHSSKIKKSFWSFLVTSSKVLPNANKVLSSA